MMSAVALLALVVLILATRRIPAVLRVALLIVGGHRWPWRTLAVVRAWRAVRRR